ncbi:monofunctional biosynthetic peptidoglycan transglycosylase [Desulfobacterium sp. N47]
MVILKKFILLTLVATIVSVVLLRWVPPLTSAFMIQKNIASILSGSGKYKTRYKWIPLNKISGYAAIAVIASEDQMFPEHFGFDIGSISDAMEKHSRGKRLRGASTISQQVAKNLFLWPGRSLIRKGFEAYFTVLIEIIWPKKRIIEVYLNIAEFGNGIFGVGAASEIFFKKPPSKLSISDAALLAAVLPNPKLLHANRPTRYLNARKNWIIGQIFQLGGPDYFKTKQ